jgi:hypothetical protein
MHHGKVMTVDGFSVRRAMDQETLILRAGT